MTRALGAAGLLAASAGLTGCDSYMDPSVVGRWEPTATSVPILTRLAIIEGPEDQFVEVSDVTSSDLVPEIETYRIGPGDFLRVTLFDIPVVNQSSSHDLYVSPTGRVSLPQLGEVFVAGKSLPEARETILDEMRTLIAGEPEASVEMLMQRQMDFTVLGAVSAPGRYAMPETDYRLLDALASAGSFPDTTPYIFVIRQFPLTEEAAGRPGDGTGAGRGDGASGGTPDPDLLDVIDDLTGSGGGAPAEMGQPEDPPETRGGDEPVIDLVEPGVGSGPRGDRPGDSSWMYLNGSWVRVEPSGSAQDPGETEEMFVTQRVIRVPVKPLLAGDGRYNIVIRPGDVVRVPPPPSGFVYVAGQVNRPGSFQIVQNLTLMRVIDSAGGLSTMAIPERVDLWRMVGDGRQAVIQVNLRAIESGTQPDIIIKADDRINVGTNFWAYPLAVVRNGFRASYGFGFLLDRNFGNDVFGAPPTNRQGF